jgi:hypothetical protein
MAKSTYLKVRLESEAEYKLRKKKYDPWATHPVTGNRGAHVWFVEKKMPPSKKN